MTFNKEYIEQVRKGEAAIWNIGKLKDTKALQEVHDICCPEDNWEVLKGFVYYGTNDGKYFWLSNDPLPPGMEAIPLKDFFEDENSCIATKIPFQGDRFDNEWEVTENKILIQVLVDATTPIHYKLLDALEELKLKYSSSPVKNSKP